MPGELAAPLFLDMWKIGDIEIDGRVILAPMAGITSLGYRRFMKPFGVALSYTEMVSAAGLNYQNDLTISYLKTDPEDHPVALQLFGHDPEEIVRAVAVAERSGQPFDLIDLNFGCPVAKVTGAGAGAALLKDPARLETFARYIVERVDKPVMAKIRLGWDNDSLNFRENIAGLERAGIAAIAIHARTKAQGFSGPANYEILRDLRSEMTVPLIVSGGINSIDDALKALMVTGAEGVMVARGALGNPYLVTAIDHFLKTGQRLEMPTIGINVNYLLRYIDLLIEEKGEETAIRILRGTAPKFLNGYPNRRPLKQLISSTIVTKDDLIGLLDEHGVILP